MASENFRHSSDFAYLGLSFSVCEYAIWKSIKQDSLPDSRYGVHVDEDLELCKLAMAD